MPIYHALTQLELVDESSTVRYDEPCVMSRVFPLGRSTLTMAQVRTTFCA